ncbi:nickel-responsive transcriptional regulator NikR [Acuticoccus yangtzensis]|uniref:nickel-responsive transcriptional regulator NikR n=1 Tax=Acuticoccus yangtzensis TaxID=1443441 RepID=UPI000ABC14DD|nr:nickel-responsive transcriptional regulator NikR [Acuticoccus yangtzensis]
MKAEASMQRVTITLDPDLAAMVDAFRGAQGGQNRSEAVRDLLRRGLAASAVAPAEAACLGVVSCAVDLSVRGLAARVPQSRLDRHDQTVAALSVPIDHSTSLEVAVLRGPVGDVSGYAEALFVERGTTHGALALVPVAEGDAPHVHADESRPHTHMKVRSGF